MKDNASLMDPVPLLERLAVGIRILGAHTILVLRDARSRAPKVARALDVAAIGFVLALAWQTWAYLPELSSDVRAAKNSHRLFPEWPRGAFDYATALLGRASRAARMGGHHPFADLDLAEAYLLVGRPDLARAAVDRVLTCPIQNPIGTHRARVLRNRLGDP